MAGGNFGGGNGEIQSPYLIEDADDFYNIRKEPHAFYKLIGSVNLMECSFLKSTGWDPSAFAGTLEGDGFSIENCKIHNGGSDIGLFTFLRGTVRNLQLSNFSIEGEERVGAMAGNIEQSQGMVENCAILNSKVTGSSYVGSFAGNLYQGEIHNSYSLADIEATNSTGKMGGLFGDIPSDATITTPVIKNCYFDGQLFGQTNYTGGLVGDTTQDPIVVNSYFSEDVGFDNGVGEMKTNEEMRLSETYVEWDVPMANHLQKVWSLSDGILPELFYNSASKFLVFGGGQYLRLEGDKWVAVSEQLPDEEQFSAFGMSEGELAGIPGYVWNKLRIHRKIELVNLRERYRIDSVFDHKELVNQGQVTDGFLLKTTINLDDYGDALGRVYFKH
ncbi:hypothetical protein [Bacillus atrophaeus]|uniref:hypothetical protein n=1 Tax=Bacillus atrophaeus TaxID=1452 RepID=UPI002E1B70AE|nr:hypothetical protein [Bacillus atrophaeus]